MKRMQFIQRLFISSLMVETECVAQGEKSNAGEYVFFVIPEMDAYIVLDESYSIFFRTKLKLETIPQKEDLPKILWSSPYFLVGGKRFYYAGGLLFDVDSSQNSITGFPDDEANPFNPTKGNDCMGRGNMELWLSLKRAEVKLQGIFPAEVFTERNFNGSPPVRGAFLVGEMTRVLYRMEALRRKSWDFAWKAPHGPGMMRAL